jgi:hypothetical protein
MSTLKVDTISEKTASSGITFSQDITATLSSSSNVKAPLNASGDAPVYACRAWVNFDGTGTVAIRASGNVSSITDNGTGNYDVNFTTAMPDTNYSAVASGSAFVQSMKLVRTYNTGSVNVTFVWPGVGFYDSADVSLTVFR